MSSSQRSVSVPPGFKHRPEFATSATSRDLKVAPRHRWFYFPHSYSYRLVNAILDHWQFPLDGTLVDNFAGSGTTLLAAQERGMSALGFDLSPLAVTVTNVKVAAYRQRPLERGLASILDAEAVEPPAVPSRLSRAFTHSELKEIFALLSAIRELSGSRRQFFLVALLGAMADFSRAVPDGGWFRWHEWPDRSEEIRGAFERTASFMIDDVRTLNWPGRGRAKPARLADARRLPLQGSCADGLITSPPYANRHDYSRVFHIALLLLGAGEAGVKKLRQRSIRSHVEAKAPHSRVLRREEYSPPALLEEVLDELPAQADGRIHRLLSGYFEDVYLSLLEVARILRPGGTAAYVVGNVRHAGVMVPTDTITAELAKQAGLRFEEGWVMRVRGNAAQQMKRYGREPSRESVILLSKDKDR